MLKKMYDKMKEKAKNITRGDLARISLGLTVYEISKMAYRSAGLSNNMATLSAASTAMSVDSCVKILMSSEKDVKLFASKKEKEVENSDDENFDKWYAGLDDFLGDKFAKIETVNGSEDKEVKEKKSDENVSTLGNAVIGKDDLNGLKEELSIE